MTRHHQQQELFRCARRLVSQLFGFFFAKEWNKRGFADSPYSTECSKESFCISGVASPIHTTILRDSLWNELRKGSEVAAVLVGKIPEA